MSEDLWSAQDTTPAEIEAALRELEMKRAAEHQGYVPARVLNLVAIVDREWRGEIANRLDSVGRYHASRTVLCTVEPGRKTLDATAMLAYDVEPAPGCVAVCRERVNIEMGPEHLPGLDTIVDPILQAWHGGDEPMATYPAGSQGPTEADELLGEGRSWRTL